MSENIDKPVQSQESEQEITSENINFDALDTDNAKVVELESKLAELTDKYYRANADFDNIKKRFEKEKADIASYANEKFARDLLPVIDALEMGLNFEPEDEFSKKIKEGIELSLNEFSRALEKHGVTAIDTNVEFDPNIHNAVLRVDSEDHDSGAIVQIIQKGYMINGRVLRPAMVSIAN